MNQFKNATTMIVMVLSACLLIYILTGFFAIFEDKGPLSALIGAIASITTCAIAIRAIFIAKKWHIEKMKSQVFEGACSYLDLINSSLAITSFLHMDLKNRVDFLNYKLKANTNFDSSAELFNEINAFLKLTYNARFDTYKNMLSLSKYQKHVAPAYNEFCGKTNLKLALFLGGLSTPITFQNGKFEINHKVIDAYKFFNEDTNGKIFNSISKLAVSEFINLTNAAKEMQS